MELYLAPMEGLTGYIMRNAFLHHFNYIDKYYTPFIPAAKKMNFKIKNDINPENNVGIKLIPQVMSNKSEEVIYLGNQLKEFGYDTVNVNLGCPSGTVTSKKRGSGFLTCPDELDRFLYELFSQDEIKVSIKTRIGYEDESEWDNLLKIYEKYEMEELTIHPRVRKDFYKNSPRIDAFEKAVNANMKTPLCYNGDILEVSDMEKLTKRFPTVDRYMIGRGLFYDPALAGRIKGEFSLSEDEFKKKLRDFHDEIFAEHLRIFSGERDAIFRMKEVWTYLKTCFENGEKNWKKIKKAQDKDNYDLAVRIMFEEG